MYRPFLQQEAVDVQGSIERIFFALAMLMLVGFFLISNGPALRVLLHKGKASPVGPYFLVLSIIIQFVSPGLAWKPTATWLSFLGFVAGFLASSIDRFALNLLWPSLFSIPLVLGLGSDLTPSLAGALAYSAFVIILGAIFYRSPALRRWLLKTQKAPPCPRCDDERETDCVFCGKFSSSMQDPPRLGRMLNVVPYLVVAASVLILAKVQQIYPDLGLSEARSFYSGLLLNSLLGNTNVIIACGVAAAIFLSASQARRSDSDFDNAAEILSGRPELIPAFVCFHKTRSCWGRADGERAFQMAQSTGTGSSAFNFARNVLELQEIGAIKPTYRLKNGMIVRGWRVR